MKAFRLFSEERAAEIVEAIRAETWEPGRSKASARNAKLNLELKDSNPVAKEWLDWIVETLEAHPLYQEFYVSRICPPKFNWYRDEGKYDVHADAPFMGPQVRTDLACTIFLTDGYKGGGLNVGNYKNAKGKPGTCVVYDCWRKHGVEPVTSGDRISVITWFQSWIPESDQREILNELHGLAMRSQTQEDFAAAGALHGKLFKLWMR